MGNRNQDLGCLGEAIARKYLRKKRFAIIAGNVLTPFGEIDIVAKHGEYVVLVEVKTRVSDSYGSPLYSITPYKRKNITNNARWYLKVRGLADSPCRIDVIAIVLNRNKNLMSLEHVKNAV